MKGLFTIMTKNARQDRPLPGEDGSWAFAVSLDAAHSVFEGHFPGKPTLPGVCSMMIVRECASQAAGEPLSYSAVGECKFLSAILPGGGELSVVLKLARVGSGVYSASATILEGERVAVKIKATFRGDVACVIPVYNNAATVRDVVERAKRQLAAVIVVNDGSDDGTAGELSAIEDITVITSPENRGKGHALRLGLEAAHAAGFTHVLTLDADGQHFPEDAPLFLERLRLDPRAFVMGVRNLTQENMPARSTFANRFSNFWFRLETGKKMADTQSGFRLYPLEPLRRMRLLTGGYEFELESAVRLAWGGTPVTEVPVRVYYAPDDERVSHFRPVKDFTRISLLNSVLVVVALVWYYPVRFCRWLSWRNLGEFVRRNITHSGESNARLAAAVGWGVMWGIMPVWGYQMIIAGVTAHLLKLNKIVVLASSNISIPPMIPLILWGSYAAGGVILGRPVLLQLHDVTMALVARSLGQYILGAVVLAAAAGAAALAASFVVLKTVRKEPGANG